MGKQSPEVEDTLKGFTTFEIVLQGTFTLPAIADGDDERVDIAHNLGYTPFAEVFLYNDSEGGYVQLTHVETNGPPLDTDIDGIYYAYVDDTELTVQGIMATGHTAVAQQGKYFLYRERADE